MRKTWLIILVIAIYVLHQDFWFWHSARPFVFGFLPIGIFYHVCYTLAVAALMWLLIKYAWPSHLETEDSPLESNQPSAIINPQPGSNQQSEGRL